VRRARPTARLIVDANQAWTRNQLRELVPQFARCGVRLIEQPLPTSDDGFLTGFESAIPLCADESCQTAESLPSLIGKYDYVNLKLDKTGGLTAALRSMSAAQAMGFEIMVGCMGGSSLSMAPAFIIGQYCSYVDLDAPLLIKADVPHAIRYDGASMHVPAKELWG
jgi:L-alanine-DL-glutamate epimerase-like enolase superfamily enzyme